MTNWKAIAEQLAEALGDARYALFSAREMILALRGTKNPNREAAITGADEALTLFQQAKDAAE
jgi:hypothetical protein